MLSTVSKARAWAADDTERGGALGEIALGEIALGEQALGEQALGEQALGGAERGVGRRLPLT